MVYLFGTIKIKIETWWFECKSFRLLLRHANSESSLSPHSSIAVLTDSIKSRISTVNFINVNLARFLYKRHFGTFFKLHVRWKSCQNGVRTKKGARKTLMKLTPIWLFFREQFPQNQSDSSFNGFWGSKYPSSFPVRKHFSSWTCNWMFSFNKFRKWFGLNKL